MLTPLISSFCDSKMKAPSSKYNICMILNMIPSLRPDLSSPWPRICPTWLFRLSCGTLTNSGWRMPFSSHFFSKASAKVDIIKRKRTGDKLSPCLTPTVCSISLFSLPTLIITERLRYMRSTALHSFGGAPYCRRISISSWWFVVVGMYCKYVLNACRRWPPSDDDE